jgi:hypothetical protein
MTGHLIEPAIKALIDTRNFTALHNTRRYRGVHR